jgi:hypothetical protein
METLELIERWPEMHESGPVRLLDDRRREQDEVGEVAAPRGQVGDGALVDGQAAGGVGLVDQALLRETVICSPPAPLRLIATLWSRPRAAPLVPLAGLEPGGRGFEHVVADGQQGRDETAVRAGGDGARVPVAVAVIRTLALGTALPLGPWTSPSMEAAPDSDWAMARVAPGTGGEEIPRGGEGDIVRIERPPRVYMPFTCPRRGAPSPRTCV